VRPFIQEILDRLDTSKNPFWQKAERACWLAVDQQTVVGRICAIAPAIENDDPDQHTARFGFFECINDAEVAAQLFNTAADWLKGKGYTSMIGPYNPGPSDEIGVMIEGFNTIPVALAGHNPPYYQALYESNAFIKYKDTVARHYIPPQGVTFSEAFPAKLMRVVENAIKREDIKIRTLRKSDWENEIRIATEIINTAMAHIPGYIPVSYEEFLKSSNRLKPFLDPRMTVIAEVEGKPIGYAVAYPDVNEALQKTNGKLDFLGTIRFFLHLPRIKRVSFKLLMILPEFQGRGVEALLIYKIAKRMWQKKYREVDMSLADGENIKSNRFTDNLGFKVYLRYRIFKRII
jgi:GNAT superfamily N-acetyltransferase